MSPVRKLHLDEGPGSFSIPVSGKARQGLRRRRPQQSARRSRKRQQARSIHPGAAPEKKASSIAG